MGACGREIALRKFGEELVLAQFLEVYRNLLGHRLPNVASVAAHSPCREEAPTLPHATT
jgi:hypothetical protein